MISCINSSAKHGVKRTEKKKEKSNMSSQEAGTGEGLEVGVTREIDGGKYAQVQDGVHYMIEPQEHKQFCNHST